MVTQKFPAKLNALHQMLQWILKHIGHLGFEKNDLRKIELASEEALVNIISHAYKEIENGKIQIMLHTLSDEKIELKFIDSGPKFNPLKEAKPFDTQAPLEKRSVGGLGILLIRQYMDDVTYERKDQCNILTLVKQIP